jgi:hypothetical protein
MLIKMIELSKDTVDLAREEATVYGLKRYLK